MTNDADWYEVIRDSELMQGDLLRCNSGAGVGLASRFRRTGEAGKSLRAQQAIQASFDCREHSKPLSSA